MIDCLDRGKWFPSTPYIRREETINGMKKVDYRVGFRVYPENLSQPFDNYKKFWPGKNLMKDTKNMNYYGDNENLDEWIPSYSKRIHK